MKERSKKKKSQVGDALPSAERELAAGSFADAIRLFSTVPKTSPQYGRACKGLGAALLRVGRAADSLTPLQIAHEAFPDDGAILVDAGDAARMVGRLKLAETVYAQARQLGAEGYQIDFGEASLLLERKLWIDAIDAWTKLLDDHPDDPAIRHNLGRAWHEVGETDRAVALMQKAFEASGDMTTLAMLAMLAPHAGVCSHSDVLRWRTEYAKRLARSADVEAFARDGRRLNIGYVSAFFHRPNWMKPVWALLNHHDRTRFKIHLFADGPPDEINVAGGYEAYAEDELIDTRALSNIELAALMRSREIDVLVDLNGYSAMPRLGLWTGKPAPVTVGWFNYYATSGMPGIEWLIGDDAVIREDEEEFYTEKIVRLKQSYLTFQVGYATADVEHPADDEPFTFGCLGSGYKITPEVRDAWIKLLQRTRSSRLLVRNRVLGEQRHREWFLKFFTDAGIDPSRLLLLGPADHDEFLRTYGQVHIALDTFPYNGGTTTMEALWQGVPIVCFSGDRWVSRTSETLLRSAGLSEFVGKSVEDYIEIAARWSLPERRDELRRLRSDMRSKLEISPVCDGPGLAKDIERIILSLTN